MLTCLIYLVIYAIVALILVYILQAVMEQLKITLSSRVWMLVRLLVVLLILLSLLDCIGLFHGPLFHRLNWRWRPMLRMLNASPDTAVARKSWGKGGSTMATGKSRKLKGRVKEAAGALTGDAKLKRKGLADQVVGNIKQLVEDAIDMMGSFFNWLKGLFA
jgi:uncharacterized protein YjbJ (UPF0337 family)